ncbi:hypothetical protein ACSVXJ_004358, partial [Providencia rettgeri]|nr:hypothetical protein [Providencia rettgeri]
FTMVDKMDLALLKQEIVDWHGLAIEGCTSLLNSKEYTFVLPGTNIATRLKKSNQIAAFRLGVLMAREKFSSLPFEVESDEESDNE